MIYICSISLYIGRIGLIQGEIDRFGDPPQSHFFLFQSGAFVHFDGRRPPSAYRRIITNIIIFEIYAAEAAKVNQIYLASYVSETFPPSLFDTPSQWKVKR